MNTHKRKPQLQKSQTIMTGFIAFDWLMSPQDLPILRMRSRRAGLLFADEQLQAALPAEDGAS